MIYFIETQGLVKIGYSANPRNRLSNLSTGCPSTCTLVAVCDGDEEAERRLHSRFGRHKYRGEWFTFHQEIHQFIAQNAIPYPEDERAPSRIDHPITRYLAHTGQSMGEYARRAGLSRMQVYRVMAGENTTTATIMALSEATDGEISPETIFTEWIGVAVSPASAAA